MYNHKAAPFPPLCRLHCTTTCWSPFPDPCWPSCWPPFLPSCQLSCPSYPFSLLPLRDVAKKKQWENVGILKKQGGGLPESHFFCNLTKCFLACQIHSEVLKHVLQ